jgi:hypothetical protein
MSTFPEHVLPVFPGIADSGFLSFSEGNLHSFTTMKGKILEVLRHENRRPNLIRYFQNQLTG